MALPVEVGLLVNGVWIDATSNPRVYERDPITVGYGRANWSSRVDSGRASFTLDNRDGRWSPDNPSGPHFGHFKRNIPCRVGVGYGGIALLIDGDSKDVISTPHATAIEISASIDVRVEFELEGDLTDGAAFDAVLADKLIIADGGWSWTLGRRGNLLRSTFEWVDSANVSRLYQSAATGANLPWSMQHGVFAVRFTLDTTNGNGRFYTAASIAGPWTQLGATLTSIGATSIGASTGQALQVGGAVGVSLPVLPGRINRFELRSGIDGTVVANPDFTAQTLKATTFTDPAGAVWTTGPGGRITNTRWRYHGELASLPVRWETQGRDVWAPVEATGLFRRLRQGNRRLDSALRRALLALASTFGTDMVAYWPMEETGDAVTLFGAAVGGGPMLVTGTGLKSASYPGFQSSAPIPVLGDAVLTATVATYTPTVEWQVRWLQHIPTGTASAGAWLDIIRVTTTDVSWVVQWQDTSAGNMRVLGFRGVTQVYTGGAIGMQATGKAFRVSLAVTPNGANVDISLVAQVANGTPGGLVALNAVAAVPGRVTEIKINEDATLDTWAVGQVTVQNLGTPDDALSAELNAHIGETAAERVIRLCAEEGIATRVEGNPADSEAMGPQLPNTLMALLEECAATDLGILHESRTRVAVAYRTRVSMVAQTPQVALDFAAGHTAAPLDLDRDDQEFANDITIENWTTATARAVLDDGSDLSISEPPVGAGRYDTRSPVNAALDSRLVALAGAYLSLNAADEPRVSRVSVGLHRPQIASNPVLRAALLGSSLGDLLTVANNLPVALGSTLISQIIQGTRDRIETHQHFIDLLTSPGSPWVDLLAVGITLVGISNTLYTGTGVTNINVPYPTVTGGILADDFAEIYVATQENPTAAQPNTPSGWNLRADMGAVAGFIPRQTKFSDKLVGGESGNVNVAWPSGTPRPYGCMLIWRGVNPTTAYDVAQQLVTTGSANPNPAAITPVTNGAVVTVMAAGNKSPAVSATISGGYIPNVDQDATERAFVGGHKTLAVAAADDPAAYSWGVDNSSVWTDALRPA
jgi:hypothetical protein